MSSAAMVKSEPEEENIHPIHVHRSLEYEHSTMNITNRPSDEIQVAGLTIKEEYQATEFHDLEQAIHQYETETLPLPPPPTSSIPDYSDSDEVVQSENSDSEFMSIAEIKKTAKKQGDSPSTSPDQGNPSTSKRKCLTNDVVDRYKRGRPPGAGVPKASTKIVDKRRVAKRPPRLRKEGQKHTKTQSFLPKTLQMEGHLNNQMEMKSCGSLAFKHNEPNMRNMLLTLLFSWNLPHLMDYFEAENIDLNVLKIVTKDDLPELTQKMKIGDKIMFKYHFERWRAENKEFRNSPFCSSISNSSSQSSAGSDGDVEKTPKLRTIDILKQHKNGVLILDTYKKDNKITEDQRNVLINIIVQHFETNDIKMTMQMSRRIENDILKLFPTEKLQFYRTGSRGKLYIKYHNQNKKVARSFNSQGKTPRRGLLNTTNMPKLATKLVPEDDAAVRVQTLKSESLSADDFMLTWSACAKFRINQIHYECKNIGQALTLWPQYKLPIGFQLIDSDFYIISETATTVIEWKEKFIKLLEFLQTHLKTRGRDIKDILTSLDKYEFEKDTDAFILKILWCLHCQVYPTKKFVRTNENGEKEFVRLTIKDSQDSFLYINETMQGLQEYIDVITRKGEQQIPPFILGLGEPKTLNVEVFYVYLDGQFITFNNFGRAFDICFKSYHVFNIEYPFASWPFWTFIEKFLYGINKTDKQNSKVCVLIDELSKM